MQDLSLMVVSSVPVLLRVAILAALVWVPGTLAVGAAGSRDREEGLLLLLFQATALGLMIVGLWGVLLACLGRFTPIWVISGVAVISLGLLVGGWRRLCAFFSFSVLSAWQAVTLVGLVVASVVFAHPHENLIVGRDPGVYTNTAIHLARTGRWVIRDPFFADLPAATQTSFLCYVWGEGPFRLPRFFWLSDRQVAVSEFLPFFTVWMALLEWCQFSPVIGPVVFG